MTFMIHHTEFTGGYELVEHYVPANEVYQNHPFTRLPYEYEFRYMFGDLYK